MGTKIDAGHLMANITCNITPGEGLGNDPKREATNQMDPPGVTTGRFFFVPDGKECYNRTALYVRSWVSTGCCGEFDIFRYLTEVFVTRQTLVG